MRLPNRNNRPIRERLLSALLVRENETTNVVYFLGFFLLIGAGMALGRGSADALFFKRYGIEHLPTMYVIMSLLLAMTGVLYAAFADRLPAERFFTIIFLVLAAVLGIEWLFMLQSGSKQVYPAYYLTYEIVSEILLVHGALYLGQNLNTLQAKRLTPIILAGAQIGSIIGGIFLAALASRLGLHNMLLIWCAILGASVLLLARWHRLRGTSTYFRPQAHTGNAVTRSIQQVSQTLRLSQNSQLLRSASFALFFMVITFYIMCYSVNRIYTQHFQSEESLATFFGLLGATTGALGLLLQVFATNRFIERFGVRRVNLMFPAFSVISIAVLLTHFGLFAALIASFNKDTIMPAFRKPVRAIIFNALPHSIQGRAHALSVVLVLPAALLSCGGLLWALQRLDNPAYFLVPGIGFALLYLYFSRQMNHAYTKALVDHLEDRLFLPDETPAGALKGSGEAGLSILIKGVQHEDEQIALTFARTLAASFPDSAAKIIGKRLEAASPALLDQFLDVLADIDASDIEYDIWKRSDTSDGHLRATLLWSMFATEQEHARQLVGEALHDDSARIRAAGVFGALNYPIPALRETALATWTALCTDRPPVRINAMQLLELLPALQADEMERLGNDCRAVLVDLQQQTDKGIIERTLRTVVSWPLDPVPALIPVISELAVDAHPERRVVALSALHMLPESARRPIILQALDDAHRNVRRAALSAMQTNEANFEEQSIEILQSNAHLSPRGQLVLLDTLVDHGQPVETLLDIAHAKTQQAQIIDEAIAMIQSHPDSSKPELELLITTLKERCVQTVDLALSALQHTGDNRQISVIRAAIRSGDHRFMANAGEALRNLDHPELSRNLVRIIETFMEGHKKLPNATRFSTLNDVIDWCRETGDGWLQTCVEQLQPRPAEVSPT